MSTEPREELLSAYLDDELSADERAQVEAWLAESADYRQLLEELRAVRHDLGSLPRHKLSEDLGPAVLRRAERTVLGGGGAPAGDVRPGSALAEWWSRGRSGRWVLWPAIAVAAALLVALFDARRDVGERQVAQDRIREVDEVGTLREGAINKRADEPADAASELRLERGRAAEESPKLVNPGLRSDSVNDLSAGARDDDAVSGEMRKAPADGQAGKFAEPPSAAPAASRSMPEGGGFAGRGAVPLKMDSNVRRALEQRGQVQLIQADVSPEFIKTNRMEQVLAGNKVRFKRLVTPQADSKDVAEVEQAPVEPPMGLWYAVDATPEQVEMIVTDLEAEQGRKQLTNLSLGLQQAGTMPPTSLPAAGEAKETLRSVPSDASQSVAKPQSTPPTQAGTDFYQMPLGDQSVPGFRNQPPVTIWLRSAGPAEAAVPAKE